MNLLRTAVQQGKLEASNTGSAEAAVRLVSVMRQFEMLQKAATLGAEMNRAAVVPSWNRLRFSTCDVHEAR